MSDERSYQLAGFFQSVGINPDNLTPEQYEKMRVISRDFDERRMEAREDYELRQFRLAEDLRKRLVRIVHSVDDEVVSHE